MLIREVMDERSRMVFTIESDRTVEDAIDLMTRRDTHGIIIHDAGRPVGILTDRDILKCYVKFRGTPFSGIRVGDAMSNKLIVARPDDEISGTISMMIRADIRHLPVVEKGGITAMLFICDMVQHQVGTLAAELRYLEDYLADLDEAGRD